MINIKSKTKQQQQQQQQKLIGDRDILTYFSFVRKIMWQLLQAVKYMHGLNIVHRDLKVSGIVMEMEKEIYSLNFKLKSNIKITSV